MAKYTKSVGENPTTDEQFNTSEEETDTTKTSLEVTVAPLVACNTNAFPTSNSELGSSMLYENEMECNDVSNVEIWHTDPCASSSDNTPPSNYDQSPSSSNINICSTSQNLISTSGQSVLSSSDSMTSYVFQPSTLRLVEDSDYDHVIAANVTVSSTRQANDDQGVQERNTHIDEGTKKRGLKLYSCKKCKKGFSRFSAARKHCARKPFLWTCDKCGTTINQIRNVRRHMTRCVNKSQRGPKTQGSQTNSKECSLCGKMSKNVNALKSHMYTYHSSGQGQIKCLLCQFSCNAKQYLKKHMTLKHSNKQKLKCKECDYRCSSSSGMRRHNNLVHSGVAPLVDHNSNNTDDDRDDIDVSEVVSHQDQFSDESSVSQNSN